MSAIRAQVSSRVRRAKGLEGGLEPAGALHGASGSVTERGALRTRALVLSGAVAACLLLLALGASLYEGGLIGGRSAATPAPRFGVASHARPGSAARERRGAKSLSSLPAMARGPVSETLGAEEHAYHADPLGQGVYGAANPAQHLSLRFDSSGVTLASGAARVGLSVRAAGYGSSLSPLGRVAPRAKANRVVYSHPGLSEWYVNGPAGLEQGFTVPRALPGTQAGPLTLAMGLSGGMRVSLGSGGQSITLRSAHGNVLRYGGVSATDARGHALHSWLVLEGRRLLLRVNTSGAHYPLRIDPWVQQGEKLTGGGERGEEGGLGFSVALSAEGSTALIGGPADSEGAGAAWVFTRSGEKWSQQGAKLTGGGEAGGGEFGASVALSNETSGSMTALIGAPGDNNGMGAVWVFTRTSGVWTQQGAKLIAKSGEETEGGVFGDSVALASKEGNTALVGAPGNSAGAGAAWVFTRTSGVWTQQGAKLTPKSGEESTEPGQFGESVALTSEGGTAVMSAPADEVEKVKDAGALWVFTRSGSTWSQQGAKLVPKSGEESAEGFFGGSVAVAAESTTTGTILAGAFNNATGVGAAWVFTRSSTTWTQQGAKLTPKSGEEIGEGLFGASVALSAEASTTYALIGAPNDSKSVGAAWVFTRTSGTWTQQGAKLTANSGEEIGEGSFGNSVALSSEGTTALMGSPGDNAVVGAGWAFARTGSSWAQQGPKLTGTGEVSEGCFGGKGEFGYSVALSPEGNTALIGAPTDNKGVGAAWVFTRTSGVWSQQGAKLTAKSGEETGEGAFGRSVALSVEATTTTALIGAPANSANVGAAWVFTRTSGTWTQQGAKLVAKSGEETGAGEFGSSVALSATEGNTALIGAAANATNVGAAWVFTRTSGTWTQQGAKLVAKSGEETGAGAFGFSVALSGKEGNTALIGAPANATNVGAVWVFLRSGSTWTQQGAKLVAKSGEETGAGRFGASVALSAEASTTYAVIGSPANEGAEAAQGVGAAWVFTRTSTTWTQQGAKLVAKSGEEIGSGEFGTSVAVSSEGTTALFGAPGDNLDAGATWVFTRSTTTWTQQGEKLAAAANGEIGEGLFGHSVAISAEGTTALMGDYGDGFDGVHGDTGAAFVFTRSGTAWSLQGGKLAAKSGEELGEGESCGRGELGYSVAISSEGNTALVGGPSYKGSVGAAWVFMRSGSTWTQQAKLLAASSEEGTGDLFGYSVALSAEGNTALIGAPNNGAGVGAAWVFTRTSGVWTQQGAKLTGAGEGSTGLFGHSVALSGDGNTALIGGPNNNPGIGFNIKVGAAWVFTRTSGVWTQQGAKLTGEAQGETGEGEFGFSVSLATNGNTSLIGGRGDNAFAGAAFVFTRSGSTWSSLGSKLTGSGESGAGEFGDAVSLSGEGNTALIGGPGDAESVGAAWVFARSGSTFAQQGSKLTGSGESGAAAFGGSVALNAEGTTALIGGASDHEGIGAAWIFTRAGVTWSQLGEKLIGGGESGAGGFGSSVALSAEGNTALMGGRGDGGGIGALWVFANSAPVAVTKPASEVTKNSAVLHATVNPDGLEVSAANCKFEYGTASVSEKSAPCSSVPVTGSAPVAESAAVSGLTGNTTYHFRISATNTGGTGKGQEESILTLPNEPTSVTGHASEITETSAVLNATVNPNGGNVTRCEFEYGTKVPYEKSIPCSALPGSGTTAMPVSAKVSGLTAHTLYHFRIVAENASGVGDGADETFETLAALPIVKTEPASEITNTSATLNGMVNPNGVKTECKFEYTTQEAFEFGGYFESLSVPCGSSPGSGTVSVPVSAMVSGLSANTTYHFRLSATSVAGTSKATELTFKTLVTAPTVVTKAASEIGPSSAILNATVNPNGTNVTKCEFEYGVVVTEKHEPCASLPGSGTSPVAVSAKVSGLAQKTTYKFRISATNAAEETSKGSEEGFKTLPERPTTVTKAASEVNKTSAILNATVNPNGNEVTECKFEYTTQANFEFGGYFEALSKPCSSSPGSGNSAVAVSASVSGLKVNTMYHFRISATNAGGTREGADETLKTLPAGPSCNAEGFCASLESYESSEVKLAPTAVAVEGASGDFWVAESAQNHLVEFNPERKYVRQFGAAGTGNGQFNGIGQIATNSSGDVYAIDPGNQRVQEFGPEGKYITQWSAPGARALAVDGEGNVWLDQLGALGSGPISEYSSAGTLKKQFGASGSAPGQLGIAYGMAFSGGHLYVAELNRVQEFGTSGEALALFDEQGSGNGKSNLPRAIAANPTNGNLYVSEVGSNHVQIFSAAGAFISAFGTPGAGAGQFSDPQGIALSSAGTVYVTDAANNRISEWKAGEPPTFSAALSEYKSSEVKLAPTAVAVEGASGDFWVAESAQNHLVEFNPERKYVRQFGAAGTGNGQFNGIGQIATNSSGDVYAIDPGNQRVQEFGPEGKYITQWSAPGARALAVDGEGNVWLDQLGALGSGPISEYSSAGTLKKQFGASGSAPGQLGIAYGMAFSGGHLYVAELNRVQEFGTSGEALALFDEQGSGNGKSNLPRAIAANPTNGNLYVSEVGSNHVQIFSAAGAFISAFGTPGAGAGQFSDPQGIAAGPAGLVYVADAANGRVQEWVPGS